MACDIDLTEIIFEIVKRDLKSLLGSCEVGGVGDGGQRTDCRCNPAKRS